MGTVVYTINNAKTLDTLNELTTIDSHSLILGSNGNLECKKITYTTLSALLKLDIGNIGSSSSGGSNVNVNDDINFLSINLLTLRGNTTLLSNSVTALVPTINNLNANYSDLREDVDNNTITIASYASNFSGIDSQIDGLTTRVSQLESNSGSSSGGTTPTTIPSASTTEIGGIKYWNYSDAFNSNIFNGKYCIPVVADITYASAGQGSPLNAEEDILPYIYITEDTYENCFYEYVNSHINSVVGKLPTSDELESYNNTLQFLLDESQNVLATMETISADVMENMAIIEPLTSLTPTDITNISQILELTTKINNTVTTVETLRTSFVSLLTTVASISERLSKLETTE